MKWVIYILLDIATSIIKANFLDVIWHEKRVWKCLRLAKSRDTSLGFVWNTHDDVIKWKHFPRCWPYVRGIHRSLVNSPHKGQWRRTLMFSLICAWINGWVNTRDAGNLRRCGAHYDITIMWNAETEMSSFLWNCQHWLHSKYLNNIWCAKWQRLFQNDFLRLLPCKYPKHLLISCRKQALYLTSKLMLPKMSILAPPRLNSYPPENPQAGHIEAS